MDENDLKAALWSASSSNTTLKISVKLIDVQPQIQDAVSESDDEEFEQVNQEEGPIDQFEELKQSINLIQQEMNNDEDESSEDDQPAKMEEGQEEAKQEYKEF